eukprot:6200933-Pleurochrysis_carterae.AAC.5
MKLRLAGTHELTLHPRTDHQAPTITCLSRCTPTVEFFVQVLKRAMLIKPMPYIKGARCAVSPSSRLDVHALPRSFVLLDARLRIFARTHTQNRFLTRVRTAR